MLPFNLSSESLFDNALKYYIEKEDPCDFYPFYQEITRLSPKHSTKIRKMIQVSKSVRINRVCITEQNKVQEPPKRTSFQEEATRLLDILKDKNQSVPRIRRAISVSNKMESIESIYKIKRIDMIPKVRQRSISVRKELPKEPEQKFSLTKISSKIRYISPEKLSERYQPENINPDGTVSPYDNCWIQKTLSRNFNVHLFSESDNQQNSLKKKWKILRIRSPLKSKSVVMEYSQKDVEQNHKVQQSERIISGAFSNSTMGSDMKNYSTDSKSNPIYDKFSDHIFSNSDINKD